MSNPFNNTNYSDNYLEYKKIWSNFPAYKKKNEIMETISHNNVILISSPTGSGKTVITPKLLIEHVGYQNKIIVCLPKQDITQSAAKFSAKIADVELGKEIGYKFKDNEMYDKKLTKILYVTDGTLINLIIKDNILSEFNGIIIDEIHERNIRIDFLLYLTKHILHNRKEFKLILMSATININLFKNYYEDHNFGFIKIEGKSNLPIDNVFLDKPTKDYIKSGFEIIKSIFKTTDSGDIIFFVPTINETALLCKMINGMTNNSYCIEIYSGTNEEKKVVAQDISLYKKKGNYNRKIIIATNVAESSMTFDGIKFVIDSGYELKESYDCALNIRRLDKQFVTKSQAIQRRGRTGRTNEGVCFFLYTEEEFNKMEEFPLPAIQTSNIEDQCLKILVNKQTVNNLITNLYEFIQPPKENNIKCTILNLYNLKLIDDNFGISDLGKIVSDINFDIRDAISIIYGYKFNIAKDIIRIALFIQLIKGSIQKIFREQKEDEKDNSASYISGIKKLFNIDDSDHKIILYLLNAFEDKYKNNSHEKWCRQYNLNIGILSLYLKKSKRIIPSCLSILNKYNKNISNLQLIDNNYSGNNKIIKSFIQGYCHNTAKKNGNTYTTINNVNANIGKNNFVSKTSGDIFYFELFYSNVLNKYELNLVSSL